MNKMNGILLLVATLISCSKEEISPRPYPRVDTEPTTTLTAHGRTLYGLISYSSVEIQDHGFIWTDTGFPTLTNGFKVSLGPKTGTGSFEATASTGLQSGKTYSACAYARSADYVVYGKIIEFEQP